MRKLDRRVVAELCDALETAAHELCVEHGWTESEYATSLCARFAALGLVQSGRLRAHWLLEAQEYSPDDARRNLIADLLLAIGVVERELGATAHFRDDGVVEFRRNDTIVGTTLPASGRGTRRWGALEQQVRAAISRLRSDLRPTSAILGGVQGSRSGPQAPPEHLISGDRDENIIAADPGVNMVSIDELRQDPAIVGRIAA